MKKPVQSNYDTIKSIQLLRLTLILVFTLISTTEAKAQDTNDVKEKIISVSKEQMQSYEGNYEMNPGSILKILIENDTLKAKGPGSPAMVLIPIKENRFFMKYFGVDIAFVANENGKVEKLQMIRPDGQTLEAKKIE